MVERYKLFYPKLSFASCPIKYFTNKEKECEYMPPLGVLGTLYVINKPPQNHSHESCYQTPHSICCSCWIDE